MTEAAQNAPTDFDSLGVDYLRASIHVFRNQKALAEKALAQLTDEQLHHQASPEANSIVIVIKHMAGNMRSRWTDFLTTDGEKPDRHRDQEFIDDLADRAAVEALWEQGWDHVFAALEPLTPDDLRRTVTIRGEPHTVVEAIQRQLSHYGYHVGQIVDIARNLAGEKWQSLSIPRGESAAFNERMGHGER